MERLNRSDIDKRKEKEKKLRKRTERFNMSEKKGRERNG